MVFGTLRRAARGAAAAMCAIAHSLALRVEYAPIVVHWRQPKLRQFTASSPAAEHGGGVAYPRRSFVRSNRPTRRPDTYG